METQPVDCDECERLFQELIKLYRQAVVGRRISGIVHNISTPLQVILMQSELMERKLKEELENFAPELPAELLPKWQDFFDYRQKKNRQLREVSGKLQQLVHWLKHRTYHEDHHGVQEINLNELLQDQLEGYQAEHIYKHRLEKRFQWHDRMPTISGFYVDFTQIFGNLIDNALEALHDVPEPVLSLTTSVESGCRVITVSDNGPGIPEAIRDHIFDPFFSTKSSPDKNRAGLGLFLARRLSISYNGEISFQSRPGQTWFQVRLP